MPDPQPTEQPATPESSATTVPASPIVSEPPPPPPPPAPRAPDPVADPAVDLAKKRDAIKEKESQIEALKKQVTEAKAEVQGIEAKLKVTQAAGAQYSAAAPKVEQTLKDARAFADAKLKMAIAGLKDRGAVDKQITDFDAALGKERDAATAAKAEADKTAAAAAEAQTQAGAAEQAYKEASGRSQWLEKTGKEVEALKDQVAKESDPAKMYFLATELIRVVDATKIDGADAYTTQLSQAFSAVETAKTAARDTRAAADRARSQWEESRKNLEKREASRRSDVFKVLGG